MQIQRERQHDPKALQQPAIAIAARDTNVLDVWNNIVWDFFTGTRVDAERSQFQARLSSCQIDEFRCFGIDAQPSSVQRWQSDYPSRSAGTALIHLMSSGACVNRQRGRSVDIRSGDAALCNPDSHYRVDFSSPYRLFVVEIPVAMIAARQPAFDVEEAGGRPIDPRRSRMLLSFLHTAWEQLDYLGEDPEWRECVSRVGFDLAIACVSDSVAERVTGASADFRKAVIEHIRANLSDSELRASAIAAALGVSRRSIQTVFERMSTTASAFILDQRLRHAERQLRCARGKRTITAIAFACGFNDSAYFSRCFHKKFGVPPRDYLNT